MEDTATDAEDTPVSTESETAETESTEQPTTEATPETEAKAEEQGSGEDAPTEDEATKQKRNRVQERITTLTNRAKDAETRANESDERARAAEARLAELEGSDPDPVPTLEQFDFDTNRYQTALMEWQTRQSQRQVAHQMTEQQRWEAKQAREQAVNEAKEAFRARQSAFELDNPDYRQVVSTYQPGSQHVSEAILNSEDGPALAYHLAKNPVLAQSIESANPIFGLMQLGQLAAQLKAPPPVTTSNTPDPVTPVKPTGKVEKSYDDMSPREFAAARNKELGLA